MQMPQEVQRTLVVGVGASAGGLEALMQLLEPAQLPFGAASRRGTDGRARAGDHGNLTTVSQKCSTVRTIF